MGAQAPGTSDPSDLLRPSQARRLRPARAPCARPAPPPAPCAPPPRPGAWLSSPPASAGLRAGPRLAGGSAETLWGFCFFVSGWKTWEPQEMFSFSSFPCNKNHGIPGVEPEVVEWQKNLPPMGGLEPGLVRGRTPIFALKPLQLPSKKIVVWSPVSWWLGGFPFTPYKSQSFKSKSKPPIQTTRLREPEVLFISPGKHRSQFWLSLRWPKGTLGVMEGTKRRRGVWRTLKPKQATLIRGLRVK